MAPFAVFLLFNPFLFDPSNGRTAINQFWIGSDIEIAFVKKGNDKNVYNRGYEIYVAVKENIDGWCNFCMSNLHKQSHMTLLVTFGLDPMPI